MAVVSTALIAVGTVGPHRPDLAARRKGDPRAVRRPTRPAAGRRTVRDLFLTTTVDGHRIDLV